MQHVEQRKEWTVLSEADFMSEIPKFSGCSDYKSCQINKDVQKVKLKNLRQNIKGIDSPKWGQLWFCFDNYPIEIQNADEWKIHPD